MKTLCKASDFTGQLWNVCINTFSALFTSMVVPLILPDS